MFVLEAKGRIITIDPRLFHTVKMWFREQGHQMRDVSIGTTIRVQVSKSTSVLIRDKDIWSLLEQLAAMTHGYPGEYRLEYVTPGEPLICSFMSEKEGGVCCYILPSNFMLVYNKTHGEGGTSKTEPT